MFPSYCAVRDIPGRFTSRAPGSLNHLNHTYDIKSRISNYLLINFIIDFRSWEMNCTRPLCSKGNILYKNRYALTFGTGMTSCWDNEIVKPSTSHRLGLIRAGDRVANGKTTLTSVQIVRCEVGEFANSEILLPFGSPCSRSYLWNTPWRLTYSLAAIALPQSICLH